MADPRHVPAAGAKLFSKKPAGRAAVYAPLEAPALLPEFRPKEAPAPPLSGPPEPRPHRDSGRLAHRVKGAPFL